MTSTLAITRRGGGRTTGTMGATKSVRQLAQEHAQTHGVCFLKATGSLTLEQALDRGEALLTIHTERATNYLVLRLTDPDGDTVGYRMVKLADFIVDRKVYDIDVTMGYGWQCDCPDAVYQSRECKHCRSLRAALTHHNCN
jgi:hypothetical protein